MTERVTVVAVVSTPGGGAESILSKLREQFEVLSEDNFHGALSRFAESNGSPMLFADSGAARGLKEFRESNIALQFEIARLAESRDEDTGRHLERTREYCRQIANELARLGLQLEADFAETIYNTSPLHDIGKIAIPDGVLCKPGKLTEPEFEIMKSHTVRGADSLAQVLGRYPDDRSLKMAFEIARFHHEKWDGTGYPDRLKGEAIPLAARIMAVADVYDALTSKRPYKEPFPHDRSCEIIREGARSHFEPKIVEAFLAIQSEIEETRSKFVDDETVHESRRWERGPQ